MTCGEPACGHGFKPRTAWQIYCSLSCADRVRHRRAHSRRSPRRPSRRHYRAFLSLIRAAEVIREMRPEP